MIRFPEQVELGENVAQASESSQALASWRDGLASLGELTAAQADLEERLADYKGKKVLVPKLHVVVTDLEQFEQSYPEVDGRALEDAVNTWLFAKLTGDARSQEILEYMGPDGEKRNETGCYFELEGEPQVTDQEEAGGP